MAPSPLLRALALVLGSLAPTTSLAAGVLVVDAAGGGDFTDLPDAVAAASPGDVVLVRTGTYSTFTVDGLALTVTADRAASVQVRGTTRQSGVVVLNLAPGQCVVLRGLIVSAPVQTAARVVRDCQGAVLAEDCTLLGEELSAVFPRHAVRVRNSGSVTLVRCLAVGGTASPGTTQFDGGHGLLVETGSTVHVYDCTLQGGDGTFFEPLMIGDGGDGGRVSDGSFLYASGSSFHGGDGGPGSSLCFIPDAGDGGAGLRLLVAAPHAELLDTLTQGGLGGPSPTMACPPGADGPDLGVESGSANLIPGVARTLSAAHPVREGELLTFDVHGLAGDLVVLGLSDGHQPAFLGGLEGTLVVAPATLTTFVFGTLPGSGQLSVVVTIPPVTGVEASLFFVQLAVATPTMPTDVRLGTGQALVLLDAAF